MLLAPFATFFLLFSSLSDVLGSARKARKSKKAVAEPLNLLHDEIVDVIFPIVMVNPNNYEMNEFPFVPSNFWVIIAGMLDPVSLWNLSLVCKHISALLRGPYGLNSLAKRFTPGQLFDVLHSSELLITSKYLFLFCSLDSMYDTSVLKRDPKFKAEAGGFSLAGKKYIITTFLPRAGDFRMLRFFTKECSSFYQAKLSTVAQSIQLDLYQLAPSNEIFYLPETDGHRLFERVDPMDICRFIWTEPEFRDLYKGCFGYSILADYVIPAWKNEYELTERDRMIIKEIMAFTSQVLFGYFQKLSWALFFVTGKKLKTERTTIGPIRCFLDHLGFEWDRITDGSMTLAQYQAKAQNVSEDLDAIYAVACHWDLDLKKIASATPSNHISQQISMDFVPDSIKRLATVSARDILVLCHGEVLDSMVQVSIVDGRIVAKEESTPKGVKRKAEDAENKTEGGIKKRRLADHPLYISDVHHPALTAGRAATDCRPTRGVSLEAQQVRLRSELESQNFAQIMSQLYKTHKQNINYVPISEHSTSEQIEGLGSQLLERRKTAPGNPIWPQQYNFVPGQVPVMLFAGPMPFIAQFPGQLQPGQLHPRPIMLDPSVISMSNTLPAGHTFITMNPQRLQQMPPLTPH